MCSCMGCSRILTVGDHAHSLYLSLPQVGRNRGILFSFVEGRCYMLCVNSGQLRTLLAARWVKIVLCTQEHFGGGLCGADPEPQDPTTE